MSEGDKKIPIRIVMDRPPLSEEEQREFLAELAEFAGASAEDIENPTFTVVEKPEDPSP